VKCVQIEGDWVPIDAPFLRRRCGTMSRTRQWSRGDHRAFLPKMSRRPSCLSTPPYHTAIDLGHGGLRGGRGRQGRWSGPARMSAVRDGEAGSENSEAGVGARRRRQDTRSSLLSLSPSLPLSLSIYIEADREWFTHFSLGERI
jgi:hypothetical protein